MSHPNKVKGNGFEREIVAKAIAHGFASKRAYGSNGQAMGEHEEVDVKIDGWLVQCKRKKALPAWLGISAHNDFVVTRENNGRTFAIIDFDLLLDLLSCRKNQNKSIAAPAEAATSSTYGGQAINLNVPPAVASRRHRRTDATEHPSQEVHQSTTDLQCNER